jgi:beta-phosphoglucomutase-like phosphatase (HAD superfamily)
VTSRDALAPALRDVRAVVLDTDGVITDSARVHAAAWKMRHRSTCGCPTARSASSREDGPVGARGLTVTQDEHHDLAAAARR